MKKAVSIFCLLVLGATNLFSQLSNNSKITGCYTSQKPVEQQGFRIRFSFTDEISKTPMNGRIIVGFQKDLKKPINNPDLFDPQPTFAFDVHNWKPGESIVMDRSNAISWQDDLDSLNGWYGVQAVLKTNKKSRPIAAGIFQAKSTAVTNKNVVYIEKGNMCMPLDLIFTILPNPPKFKETEFIKEVNIKSELLTKFYGEKDSLLAAVILPQSYFKEKGKFYPTVYVFGGWGSSPFFGLSSQQKRYGMSGFGDKKIFVFVNHECRSGYHVFCSSETNGPREETFFQELIPYIEKEYRVHKNPQTRFLMGQSSGAWAGLWLLINYPDQFGGAYVASPDPVDFTEFIGTNIYEKNANLYFNLRGEPKSFKNFTVNLKDTSYKGLLIKDFVGIDRIAGWGEQMYSFDATFSKRDSNGEPQHLFDWHTGAVNPGVADSWKSHDLSKVISNFDRKKKQLLHAKIHIYVAEDDEFETNIPVKVFLKTLTQIGIVADIRFFPSGGHDVWTDELRKLIHDDMDRKVHLTMNEK
jgi:S-formylglutathione hydrolase FrmB